jgi:hypothetical protein
VRGQTCGLAAWACGRRTVTEGFGRGRIDHDDNHDGSSTDAQSVRNSDVIDGADGAVLFQGTMEAKLRSGAKVADVGCGHGASTIVMAEAYRNRRLTDIGTARSGLSVEMTAHIERLGALQRLVHSGWISRAILAAVELRVPDALAGGPRVAVDIAGDVGADPTALNRLMRALTSIGLFDVSADGAYELTVLGELLRAEARDSMRDSVLLMGGGQRAWAQLTECVRTGDHAVKLLDGIDDPFEGFSPEARAVFDEAMVAGTKLIAGAVALAYDFSGMRSIVDVGGGRGALLPPILRANPAMTGTVFDLPTC